MVSPVMLRSCSEAENPWATTPSGIAKMTTTQRHHADRGSRVTCQIDTYMRPSARDSDVAPAMVIRMPITPKAVAEVGVVDDATSTRSGSMPSPSSARLTNSWLGSAVNRITTGSTEVKAWAASVIERSVRSLTAMSRTIRTTRCAPGIFSARAARAIARARMRAVLVDTSTPHDSFPAHTAVGPPVRS